MDINLKKQPGIISIAAEFFGYTSTDAHPLSENISSQDNNPVSKSKAYSGGGNSGRYYGGYDGLTGGAKSAFGISGSGRNVTINHSFN